MSAGFKEPSTNGSPGSTMSPSFTFIFGPNGTVYVFDSVSFVTITSFFFFDSFTFTFPAISVITANPFGLRASNSSSTLGRPCVISEPIAPPACFVFIVSCVPGSPID